MEILKLLMTVLVGAVTGVLVGLLYFVGWCYFFWIHWLDMPLVGWAFALPIVVPLFFGVLGAKENVG